MPLPKMAIMILAMAAVTYLIRMIPLVFFRKKITSVYLKSLLYYIPYAVLSAMTFPYIFYSTGNLWTALIGTIVAIIASLCKRSLIVVAILSLLIYLTFKFSITTAIIPYELLICMAFLIIKTDNLLLKNDAEIMADYNRIKMLKERVKEYSTLDKREIENIKLWDFYMTSAVAFGVARKAIVQSDVDMKFERVDKGYLVDLVIDVLEAFIEVNLQ